MDIKRAERKDTEGILRLLSAVLEIHAKLRPDIFMEGKTKYTAEELEEMITDDNNPIYVAKAGETVVGYVFCKINDNPATNNTYARKEVYIDDLCVDEKFRGEGVAKALFEYVKKRAFSRGADAITLNVWAGNERAERFYEKMGFFARKTMMEFKVEK